MNKKKKKDFEELSVGLFSKSARQYSCNFPIFLQHFVFATHMLIDFLVPDIPESLDIAIKREAYIAKRAMSEGHALAETDTGDELDDRNIDVKVQ